MIAIEKPDVIQAQEPAGEEILSMRVLAVDPPGEVDQQLLKNPLEEKLIAMPLGGVMDAADRVAAGNYDVRVVEHGPPSIRALARAFNTMTARLQDSDRLRRDLMADIAHELRTPLTVIQGKLEGLIDGVYPRDDTEMQLLLDETRVLSRLIEDLRTLALSEGGALKLQREPTDIAGLARDVARVLGDAASERRLLGEIERAHAAFTELVENAIAGDSWWSTGFSR